jgi:hypothetical protein
MAISAEQAYIAIRPDGFVDGACFTESADSEQWKADMKASGFTVEVRGRAEAKELLFTTIQQSTLLA